MNSEKKTKIVATIGPATQSEEQLTKLLKAGLNVMRLNFSHGDFAEHQIKVDNLKKASKKTGISAATMQDLGGPKIRIGDFKNGAITLKEGQKFTITTDPVVGDETKVSVNYKPLPKEINVGGFILLHDGKKKLEVLDIKGNDIICKVLVGGEIKNRRGVNLPGAHLSISSLTEKDKKDLEFGIKNKVEYIAFSFVRRADDIRELRALLKKAKMETTKIIAKVEDTEGLENIHEIIDLVDGVMVARGDMAIEIGAENVPMVQKSIIRECNEKGKAVITATHMLESMIKNPVPTRAEVSDIANAIIDGTDAIMLSEETTLGDYPVEAVAVMTRVALKIENDEMYKSQMKNLRAGLKTSHNVVDAITREAVDVAEHLNAACIVALTHTGFTAEMISRYKPQQPILVMTPSEVTARQILLNYGCVPIHNKEFKTFSEALQEIKKVVVKMKFAKKGDKIVISVGYPFEKKLDTNVMMVETV